LLREVDPDQLGFVYEACRKIVAALPPGVPLIGFAGAPFTVASYLIEGGSSRAFEHTKTFMLRYPQAWHTLLDRVARATAAYLNRQVEAGAGALQLFDSWVGCLSPELYREFVLPHSRAVFEALPRDIPCVHFGRGTGQLLELMRMAGGDVMGIDYMTSLEVAWERLGADTAVQGNLDPVVLLTDRQVISERLQVVLRQAGGRPGHVFNLGHGLLPTTPVDNVRFLVDEVRRLSSR
ncbi:MAG: uroporphyrinogen decarboxylase family protein, partial [Candidatus Eremiobacterota bacterium]